MYKKKSHQVEDRIVSIHQPHVRPIVRGKAKARRSFARSTSACWMDAVDILTGMPLTRAGSSGTGQRFRLTETAGSGG